jgi:hypothetical protein
MNEIAITVAGLPQSGKSTFLAALWHLVTTQEISTLLRLDSLRDGDAAHLNAISDRWREARKQDRTPQAPNRLVSMKLRDDASNTYQITFPDISGEIFSGMWERRECDPEVSNILTESNGVLLFIHADTIQAPHWIVDVAALSKKLGIPISPGQEVPWQPKLSPTQVQQVDLLQLLRLSPLDIRARRLAIMLSAWDKVEAEGLDPITFLATRLPLLSQYLTQGADDWDWRVYGVSAQGGEYAPEPDSDETLNSDQKEEVNNLRRLELPSERIRVVNAGGESHDLTEPIAWLKS